MVDAGEEPRLPLESLEPFLIVGDRGRQHLDRDVASELSIARAIHLSHSAFTELGDDLVVGDPCADEIARRFQHPRSHGADRRARNSCDVCS